MELRPYQETAVQKLRLGLAGGVRRQMLCSPTGSGKTEIGMAIVKGARAKSKRVAFLCNRIHLVEQTSRRFTKSNISHGIIQGENTSRLYEDVLVASIQTVARRGMPDVDLILIDEAHGVAGSKDYRAIVAAAKNIPIIGLSATPYARGLGKHYDEMGGALFESMVVASTISQLIADGFLVDCDVYGPSEPDMTGIKQTKNAYGEMDYSDADVGRAVDKPELVGDIVRHWFKLAKDTPTVCFASNIAHSKHIVEQFVAAGVTAEHVDCYTDDVERQAILARISSGETMVISNVGILAEGWDFPACKTLILARPTKSLIRYIQMAGRVLRPHESKERALILDHSGTVRRLGFPTDDFPLELDDGKPKETKGSEKREEKLPTACSSCSYMKPAKVHKCPICGFAPRKQNTIETAPGELQKMSKKDKSKAAKLAGLDKQDVYSELLAIKNARGYSDGWVAHQYKDVFGVWPRGLRDICKEPSQAVLNMVKAKMIRYSKGKAKAGEKHVA